MNLDDRIKLRAIAKLCREASDAIDKVEADYPQLREASASAFRAGQCCVDAVLEDEQGPRAPAPIVSHEWDPQDCAVCHKPITGGEASIRLVPTAHQGIELRHPACAEGAPT